MRKRRLEIHVALTLSLLAQPLLPQAAAGSQPLNAQSVSSPEGKASAGVTPPAKADKLRPDEWHDETSCSEAGGPDFTNKLALISANARRVADAQSADKAKPLVDAALALVEARPENLKACPLELRWLRGLTKAFATGEEGKVDPFDLAGRIISNKWLADYAHILAKIIVQQRRKDAVHDSLVIDTEMTGHAYGRTRPWYEALIWTAEVSYAFFGVDGAGLPGKYSIAEHDAQTALRIVPIDLKKELKARILNLYRIRYEALSQGTEFVGLTDVAQEWVEFAAANEGQNSGAHIAAMSAQVKAYNRIGRYAEAERIAGGLIQSYRAGFSERDRTALTLELARARIGQGEERDAIAILSAVIQKAVHSNDLAETMTTMEAINIVADIYLRQEEFALLNKLHGTTAENSTLATYIKDIEVRNRDLIQLADGKSNEQRDLIYEIGYFLTIWEIGNDVAQSRRPNAKLKYALGDLFHSGNSDYYGHYMLLLALDELGDSEEAKSSFWRAYWLEKACWQADRGSERVEGKEGRDSINYLFLLSFAVPCKTAIYGDKVGSPGERDKLAWGQARHLVSHARANREVAGGSAIGDARFSRKSGTDRESFVLLADLDYASTVVDKSPPDHTLEVFDLLQEAGAGAVSRALARQAARRYAVSQSPTLAEIIEQRDTLSKQWLSLRAQISRLLSDESDRRRQILDDVRKRATVLEDQLAGLDSKLKHDAPQYLQILRQPSLSDAQARRLLRSDEAVLLVVPSGMGTHILAVTSESLTWKVASITEHDVNEIVARLRQDLDPAAAQPGAGLPKFNRTDAYRLYKELIQPVADALRGKTHLFIAADGSLSSLPFGVLVTQEPRAGEDDSDPEILAKTHWFADTIALVQIPSLQSLAYLRTYNAQRRTAPGAMSFAGYGAPTLSGTPITRGSRSGDLPARDASMLVDQGTSDDGAPLMDPAQLRQMHQLPGTAVEIRSLQRALAAPESSVRLGATMTEAGLKNDSSTGNLARVAVLDIATHGLTASESATRAEPGLVFTPPDSASDLDDGYLSASEVLGLDLSGTDWVILSACNSGAPSGKPSEAGLSGLARAFFYAGANDLLVSHWAVYDEVAATITADIIRRAQNPRTSRAQALQAAMRALRQQPRFVHPSAWAPFTLVGER